MYFCESNYTLVLYDLKSVSQPPVVTSLNATHCDVTFTIDITTGELVNHCSGLYQPLCMFIEWHNV